jgi:hypothetical protein
MTIAECYRLLQLSPQASLAEVKASYRRLARQYHPDVNASDRQAQEKFIQVTEAYKQLVKIVPARVVPKASPSPAPPSRQPAAPPKPSTHQQPSHVQAPNPTPQTHKPRETVSQNQKSHPRQSQQPDPIKRPPPAESPSSRVRVRQPQPPSASDSGVRNSPVNASYSNPNSAAKPGTRGHSGTSPSGSSYARAGNPQADHLEVGHSGSSGNPGTKNDSAAKPSAQPSPVSDPQPSTPPISTPFDLKLKLASYTQLQELLKYRYFARAVALIEGLAQRLPYDAEVRQWQAITYQCWGRHLVSQRQLHKARYYFKKALHTDPHNKSLSAEVEQDVRRLEKIR